MKSIGSINAKVLALIVVAGLATVVVGVTGATAISTLSGQVDRMAAVRQALHNQAEADGANYAIEYDVLAAATTHSAAARTAHLADLAERQQTLGQVFGQNRTLLEDAGAGEQARGAFDAVTGPLEAYLAAASAAADTLTANPAAAAGKVRAVDSAQDAFDGPFDQVTEAINQFAATVQQQADRRARRARPATLLALLIACLLIPAVGMAIRRAINRTTGSILDVVTTAADGDLTREVTIGGNDAIGRMGQGMARFLADLRGSIGGIGRTANTLSAAAAELLTVSDQMAAAAQTTSTQAQAVSSAAEQVSDNVGTVAAGTQQMGEAISVVAGNAGEAASVAAEAVAVAETTNATVVKLGESSAAIGEVVNVINSIAEQTNLLALNATIEAARAGEAGRGFAIVAGEVKELARATGTATADIATRIKTIQADTGAAIAAIGQIGQIVSQISRLQVGIASAVEDQTATTAEISRSVSHAADSSQDIAHGITGVAQATAQASNSIAETRRAADGLAGMAAELQRLVSRFTC